MKGFRDAAWVGVTLLAAACSSGSEGNAIGPPDGGSGLPGATECVEDSTCWEKARGQVAELGMTGIYTSTLSGSRCGMVGIIGHFQGIACVCEYQGGGVTFVGPPGCQSTGRSGACLWDIPDGLSCDGEPPEFCTGLCEELDARRAADVTRSYDAEVRLARCADPYCEMVLRIEDRCYPGVWSPPGYDCALSDEEILAAERARLRSITNGP